MPRDTQPQSPDQLYARVIFTFDEYSSLTLDQLVLLDNDLTGQLRAYQDLGWTYRQDDVVDSVIFEGDHVIVSKSVSALAFGILA